MPRTTSRGGFSDTFQNRSKNSGQNLLRVVGIDGGSVSKARNGKTVLVAVLFNGPRILDLRFGDIEVDGLDAQRILLSLLRTLRYDVVMLSAIAFAGFNLVDIKMLAGKVRRPVIAVIHERPNNNAVLEALKKHFDDWPKRWEAVKNAGRIYSCKPFPTEPKLYFEVNGGSPALAKRAIASSCTISRSPEPVRVAGILAKGLSDSAVKVP